MEEETGDADKKYHEVTVKVKDLRMLAEFRSTDAENIVKAATEMLTVTFSEARRQLNFEFLDSWLMKRVQPADHSTWMPNVIDGELSGTH